MQTVSPRRDRRFSSTPPLYRKPLGIALLVLLIAITGGVGLGFGLDGHLVLRPHLSYLPIVGWGLLILTPVFLVMFMCSPSMRTSLRERMPTAAVRWLIGYPLTALMMAGMVLGAPLGWYMAYAKTFGAPARLTTVVTEVEPWRGGRGCKRHARLELWAQRTQICIADHPLGPELRVGQTLELQGRSTDWAFYLEVARPLPAE